MENKIRLDDLSDEERKACIIETALNYVSKEFLGKEQIDESQYSGLAEIAYNVLMLDVLTHDTKSFYSLMAHRGFKVNEVMETLSECLPFYIKIAFD
ncbi:MAG: hypothetical protein QXI33_01410 [Candidatus Pacearchaeota archaeon]